MKMRPVEVHPVADDAAPYPVDHRDGSVWIDGFDDPDVGQAVVSTTVATLVIGVSKKHQVPRLRMSVPVDLSMPERVAKDRLRSAVSWAAIRHQIDSRMIEDRPHEAGAVV